MKKYVAVLLTVGLLALTACNNENNNSSQTAGNSQSTVQSTADTQSSSESLPESGSVPPEDSELSSKILIAYFTVPEDDVDTVASASVVIKDGQKLGNTEYVAKLIQRTIGGDLFEIKAAEDYPLDHDTLVDQAADEKADKTRPALADSIDNFADYDTVILGYPNWWADLPMPVYTFLEQYDFSGKTVIPFVTHGGSGFSSTVKTITDMLPDSTISDNTLSLSRNDVAGSESTVAEWASGLIE